MTTYKYLGWTLCALFLFPLTASAHTVNQPPFIDINGAPTGYYNVGYASLPNLNLPQDSIPGKVVVKDVITFHIITANLPILPEELSFITFHWDLGDNTTFDGTDFTHSYTKAAPYIVTLTSHDTRTTDKPQVLDIVLLNVLPTKNYTLPTGVITVNGQHSTDFYKDILHIDFGKKVLLDASQSKAGTSKITSYTWDLGDEQLSNDKQVYHLFNPIISTDWPVLRVQDSLGFYTDTSVQLANSTLDTALKATPTPSTAPTHKPSHTALILFSILGGLLVLGATGFFLLHRRPH